LIASFTKSIFSSPLAPLDSTLPINCAKSQNRRSFLETREVVLQNLGPWHFSVAKQSHGEIPSLISHNKHDVYGWADGAWNHRRCVRTVGPQIFSEELRRSSKMSTGELPPCVCCEYISKAPSSPNSHTEGILTGSSPTYFIQYHAATFLSQMPSSRQAHLHKVSSLSH
jgi:hypothetical protein